MTSLELKEASFGEDWKIEPPPLVYAGLLIENKEFYVAIKNSDTVIHEVVLNEPENKLAVIINWFDQYEVENNCKIAGVGIVKNNTNIDFKDLSAELWLRLDSVPYTYKIVHGSYKEKVEDAAEKIAARFDSQNIIDILYGEDREIHTHCLYGRKILHNLVSKKQYDRLNELAKEFNILGGSISFFSATPRGGGVALMRHALIRQLHIFNVDANWYVVAPDERIFQITKKKIHNVLQGITKSASALTWYDKKLFENWSAKNAKKFHKIFKNSSVIVIDDPQPSGLIPHIKKINPNAKIIYRSHIQIDTDLIKDSSTVQSRTWDYLWGNIKHADIFVSHPVQSFVPHTVSKEKVVFAPATTDRLDGLNKPLSDRQKEHYLREFNQILFHQGQAPLNPNQPYIIQVARFDPAKGIPDVIESYSKLCETLAKENTKRPQLVIVGHSSIDDPDGRPIYDDTLRLIHSEKYKHLANDIKVVRLHSSDQILNMLVRLAKIALQLSHREGFEVKVTEILEKGIPIIAYKAGGIPLQIEDGVSGYLVEVGDTDTVAKHLHDLYIDNDLYKKMSKNAEQLHCHDYFTIGNSIKWLHFAISLLKDKKIDSSMTHTCKNLPKLL